MRLPFLLLPFLLLASAACKKYAPADEAFFIKPATIAVAPTKLQGTASHKITDLWLYVNGKFQGAYPVEHTMPIVSKGQPVKINILAGIKKNGIADTRIFWNFYNLLEVDTFVPSGKTIERNFTFTYHSAVTFTWMENFDTQGTTIQRSRNSDTTITIVNGANAFEGNSARLALSASAPVGSLAQVESASEGFALPLNTPDIFMELNYKCNVPFTVGVIGDDGVQKPALNINPQSSWNKIYIQVADAVGLYPTSPKYKMFFGFLKSADVATPEVYLDNIKLVYIK